jgi:hypothetical protein
VLHCFLLFSSSCVLRAQCCQSHSVFAIFYSPYNLIFWPNTLPSCISAKTFGFFILYTSTPHSKIKDRLKELVQLWLIKQMINVDTNTLSQEGVNCILWNNTLILQKSSLKLISLNARVFYGRLFLVDVFLDRRSAYLYGIYEN